MPSAKQIQTINAINEDASLVGIATQFKFKNKEAFRYRTIPFEDADNLLATNGHRYEIIRTGQPMKLYFDIDFNHDDEETAFKMVLDTINNINDATEELFSKNFFQNSYAKTASGVKKGKQYHSYHFVAQNIVFKDFENLENAINALKNIINDEHDIIDWSVYSRNRNFRCLNQSKVGDNRVMSIPPNGDEAPTNPTAYFVGVYGEPTMELITFEARNEPETPRSIASTPRTPLNICANEMTEWFGETPEGCLKHIPADDYQIWVSVGMALKRLGVDFQVQNEWSATSHKYNPNSCTTYWESFDTTRRGYGFNHLQKLARSFSPIAYENFQSTRRGFIFRDLKINHAEIPYYEKHNGKYLPEIDWDDETKTYILEAGMGRGKSTQIKRLIPKHSSCLIITPRRSYAQFIHGDLSEFDFTNYLDDREKIAEYRVICSPESITRCLLPKYDIVILDESETILKSMTSLTMRKNSADEGLRKIQNYLRNAKKVVLADAFVSKRTLAIAEDIGGIKRYIHLSTENEKRIMNQIAIKKTKSAKEVFSGLIQKLIQKGKNLYIVCLSKELMLTQFEPIIKDLNVPQLMQHADNKDEMTETLKDVNNTWNKVRVVMTTPTITIGINFKPETPQFHHRIIYSNGFSAVARDVAQSIDRVRETLTNEDFIYMSDKQNNAKLSPTTYEEMKQFLERRYETICEMGIDIRRSSPLIQDIHTFNEMEESICRLNWVDAMEHYLGRMNYEVRKCFLRAKQTLNEVSPRDWDELENDETLLEIDPHVLTEYQKLAVEKMNLISILPEMENEQLKCLWEGCLNKGRNTLPLTYLKYEVFDTTPQSKIAEEVFYDMKRERYEMVKELFAEIGVNTFKPSEPIIITRGDIDRFVEKIQADDFKNKMDFVVEMRGKQGGNQKNAKQFNLFLSKFSFLKCDRTGKNLGGERQKQAIKFMGR